MTKKQVMKLTIQLWKELSESIKCDSDTKTSIYNKICDDNDIPSWDRNSSQCFLCDKYYDKSLEVGEEPCRRCPLYKADDKCDNRNSTYNKWCGSNGTVIRHNAENMLKKLKQLK